MKRRGWAAVMLVLLVLLPMRWRKRGRKGGRKRRRAFLAVFVPKRRRTACGRVGGWVKG